MPARKFIITACLFTLAVIPPAAVAQYPGGPGGRPSGAGAHGERPPTAIRDRPADTSSVGGPVLVQLDQLENELKLTPEQRPAWNAFGDLVLHLADDMTRSQFIARTAPRPTDTTAAQQLDALAETERSRMKAVEEIVKAGKVFYAMLTDQQKAIADRKLVLLIRPLATGVPLPRIGETGNAGGASPGR